MLVEAAGSRCIRSTRILVNTKKPALYAGFDMAERVGFEPTIPVKVCPLSRRIVSTTHAPLRWDKKLSKNLQLAEYLARIPASI
jgi:hypothetical protein